MVRMNKYPTSFRLSPEAKRLLSQIAKQNGISQTATIEILIREKVYGSDNGCIQVTQPVADKEAGS
jgi:predicted transcriptional regulator